MKPSNKRNHFIIFASILLVILGGCSLKRQKMPPLASIEGESRHFTIGQIIQVKTGETLAFDQFIDQLNNKDVVFVGEVHDNPEHHLIQVQIMQALMSRQPITVAMEFFQKPHQTFIDQYMANESSEAEFLKNVGWYGNWSFDYSFYRPLILEVKARGGHILAINAPNKVVKKVAKSGIANLEPEERLLIAKVVDLGDKKHQAYVQEIFDDEAHGHLIDFNYFYEAQCVWEDTMAETIAQTLEGAEGTLLVLSGNGHIINKFGIPNRTITRIPADMATVLLLPIEERLIIERDSADFIWLTGKYPRRNFFMHHHKKGE